MKRKETLCVHPHPRFEKNKSGVTSPLYTSTAYNPADSEELVYPGFFSTSNQQQLASIISELEGGVWGMVFNSGMAAITTTILAMVKRGDHILFSRQLYGGTWRFAEQELKERGVEASYADNQLLQLKSAVKKNTKVIYIETPSNPLLSIVDLQEVAGWARKNNILTIVDNTFATPINQQPIASGIDMVVHSGTKYLGGHNDLPFGALVIADLSLKEKLLSIGKLYGGALSPFSCYLAERSIKTLYLRMQKHNENAQCIATYLETHKHVKRVYYPGLASHRDHAVAQKQMLGFGGILSFEIAGNATQTTVFFSKLQLISPALSLGGVESLICVPAETSHKILPKHEREKQGITDQLLRLSVGIEHTDDLINDLENALG